MKGSKTKKALSAEQREKLLGTLKARFEKNMKRHEGVAWNKVETRLEANPEKLWSLGEMEATGGEPDVVDFDRKTGEVLFVDCSAQSPKGRTSLCYDREALESRKEFKPKNSAMDLAEAMGIDAGNLSRDLRGKQQPGPKFIAALCAALEAELDDLFEVVHDEDAA